MQNYAGVVREIRFVGKLVSKMAQELSLTRSSSDGTAGTSQKHGHTPEHDELLHDNQKCF